MELTTAERKRYADAISRQYDREHNIRFDPQPGDFIGPGGVIVSGAGNYKDAQAILEKNQQAARENQAFKDAQLKQAQEQKKEETLTESLRRQSIAQQMKNIVNDPVRMNPNTQAGMDEINAANARAFQEYGPRPYDPIQAKREFQQATGTYKYMDNTTQGQAEKDYANQFKAPESYKSKGKRSAGEIKKAFSSREGFVAFGKGVAENVKQDIIEARSKPVETAVGIGVLVAAGKFAPKLTTAAVGVDILTTTAESPQKGVASLIEIGALSGVMKAPKIVRKTTGLALNIENIKAPTKTGEISVWKGISADIGSKNQPILGITGKGFKVGTPKAEDLNLKGIIIETYQHPITRTERTIISQPRVLEKLGVPKEQFPTSGLPGTHAEKISVGTSIMADIEGFKPDTIASKLPRETKTLEPQQVEAALSFTKANIKSVEQLYGSFTMSPQMNPKASEIRKPGDIDIQTKLLEKDALKFRFGMEGRINKAFGPEVKQDIKHPLIIENAAGIHAVDIHAIEPVPIQNIASKSSRPTKHLPGAYGFEYGRGSIKIEKIPVMKLEESGLRKFGASLIIQKGKIGALDYRLKDPVDAYKVGKNVLLQMETGPFKALRKGRANRLALNLERWKQLYPEADWADTSIQTGIAGVGEVKALASIGLLPVGVVSNPLYRTEENKHVRSLWSPGIRNNIPSLKIYTSRKSPSIKASPSIGSLYALKSPSIGSKRPSVGYKVLQGSSRLISFKLSSPSTPSYPSSPIFKLLPIKSPSIGSRKSSIGLTGKAFKLKPFTLKSAFKFNPEKPLSLKKHKGGFSRRKPKLGLSPLADLISVRNVQAKGYISTRLSQSRSSKRKFASAIRVNPLSFRYAAEGITLGLKQRRIKLL